ncbi:RidA family protein [Hamadaea tsunoensis]|uniref:RidA family protein n=1 Tax=Hamadaea tsunoensis TaxID=53368 RepID=UPI000404C0F9|nr:RidA family protein [Hamadaea tsunoensis]
MTFAHHPATGGYAQLSGVAVADVVHVAEYVTPAADPAAVAADRVAFLGGHRVPVSRIPVRGFPGSAEAYRVGLSAYAGGGLLIDVDGEILREAGGIVHLPSLWTAAGEFRDQYRWCLERAGQLLAGAGLDLRSLVSTVDYTATATRGEYARCGRPRRDLLGDGPVHPGAAGILADHPLAPGAHVALDVLAARGDLRAVNPGWDRYDTLTYKPAVVAGREVFGSGFGALDPGTQLAVHAGDLLAQARFVYDNIAAVLAAAGGARAVALVEYVTPAGAPDYGGLAALRRERFPDAAVTSVVCDGLLRPEFLIEVVPRAVLP